MEKEIETQNKNLEIERQLYKQCTTFSLDDQAIIERIVKLINACEGEEYIFHEFSYTREGYYITKSSSCLDDLIGVIDYHEIMEAREFYQQWIEPQTYTSPRIVPKSACEGFLKINFTNIDDFIEFLNKAFNNQNSVTFNELFKPEDFADKFLYVKKYLGRLINWRLENHTLEIPEEVMDELLNIPKQPEEMKLNKRKSEKQS